jgi:hygromycin-B 4-O-kinase
VKNEVAAPAKIGEKRARAAIEAIAQRYFGERPRRLKQREGGLTNLVYEFGANGAHYIVRVHSDPTKVHGYLKELWATARAREAGVPVPAVLEVGNEAAPFPYMVVEKAEGVEATAHPDRLAILHELGEVAARIHSIRTSGYGEVFDWSGNTLSRCERWPQWLSDEYEADARIQTLIRLKALDNAAAGRLRAQVEAMKRWRRPPALQHGDLRLKNVLVEPDSGRIVALLDWEHCVSAPPPIWDLSVALHDLGIDEKQALLDGLGLKPRALASLMPLVRAFNVMNYAPVLKDLAARRESADLAWHRARLQGLLDVFTV